MNKNSKIYVAGHNGLVGSAIVRKLTTEGFNNLVFTPHKDYDLRNQQQVNDFFEKEKPEYVFLSAAKVGGIYANSTYPADFIYDNLMIECNIIHTAHLYKVKKLLFLGSSCIYPKECPQPIKEEYLLTGSLEPTNEAYALAKISGLKMCQYYRQQYGDDFISAMPTNMYGINDNFNLENSHVLPALIRKIHLAKCLENNDFDSIRLDLKSRIFSNNYHYSEKISNKEILSLLELFGITQHVNDVYLTLWGSGEPYREFLYTSDLSDALLFLMNHYSEDIHINIGTGNDLKISDLAQLVQKIIGFKGKIKWDISKPEGTFKKLLDVSKLRQIGWKEQISLETGIKTVYDHVFK